MIVGATHVRDDAWILPRKLRAYSRFCDALVVVMDRATPEVRGIVADFARVMPVVAVDYVNTLGLPDLGPDGPICEEGRLRQLELDLAAKMSPTWVVLGDADEIPTPSIVPWLLSSPDPQVDVWRLPWIHLYKSPRHYAGGSCAWSPENPAATRKGVILRWRPGVGYRYPDRYRHVSPQPEADRPLVVLDTDEVRLMHWKYVAWQRWKASKQAGLAKYRDYWRGLRVRQTPAEWLWS